jgi:hypothetical protein
LEYFTAKPVRLTARSKMVAISRWPKNTGVSQFGKFQFIFDKRIVRQAGRLRAYPFIRVFI